MCTTKATEATNQPTSFVLHPQAAQAFFAAMQHYPDFLDGVEMGKQSYYDMFEGGMDAQEIREEIEETISHKSMIEFLADMRKHNEHLDQPFFFALGLAVGEIHESLIDVGQSC